MSFFSFFNFISILGGEKIMLIASIIICLLVFFYKREKRISLFILFNYLITMGIVIILKFIVEKPRNVFALVVENSYAFPSGHTAAAMTTSLILFYIAKFDNNKSHRILLKSIGFLWLVLIISARLYLEVHDIYDILASIIISIYIFYISLNIKIFKSYKLKNDFKKIHKHK